jgi:uncharacterized coiled-coil protein SlyX
MSYEDEYRMKQLEVRLSGQNTAKLECEMQILKHKKEIERYDETLKSLAIEISKTKLQLGMKGGE